MHTLTIGDVTITSIIERDGPWRKPEDMFPAYDAEVGARHLAEMDPVVFDAASGRMVITYQTFLVRTPKHTVLIDTCTGEDKGYPPPFDFPKQPWLDNFKAAGVGFADITHVFCTHLHIDHTGWNTMLRNGRWVPTFPNAKYIFHKGEYAYWEEMTRQGANPPGNVWTYNCRPIVEAGQALTDEESALLARDHPPGLHISTKCDLQEAKSGIATSATARTPRGPGVTGRPSPHRPGTRGVPSRPARRPRTARAVRPPA